MIEYIVSLRKGVDLDQFHSDMISEEGGNGIPSRSVEVVKLRPGSRNFHYLLSSREARVLRLNPKVFAVETNPDNNEFIEHHNNSFQEGNFTKPDTRVWEDYVNWGLMRSSNRVNVYGGGEVPSTNKINYVLDGSDVDIVIMDSGVQADHPEFRLPDGTSRVKTINWPRESGQLGILQPPNFYKDFDGHGTHVAAIAAGKTFGWAKNAHIYPMHVNLGSDFSGVPISDAFDLIYNWHIRKTTGRPTVINMSWGVTAVVNNVLLGGNYRGTEWAYQDFNSRSDIEDQFGILNFDDRAYRFHINVASYDVSVQDLIDVGCHVVIAAGNRPQKVTRPNTVDYDNRVYFSVGDSISQVFTHRPGSPHSDDAINVGALGVDTIYRADLGGTYLDTVWGRSTRGPAVDIFAPGEDIMSAYTSTPDLYFRLNAQYPQNTLYRQATLTGTSMAAPQVAGVVARIAQIDGKFTPKQMKQKISSEALVGSIQDSAQSEDYSNFTGALLGASNRILLDKRNATDLSGTFTRMNYVNFRPSFKGQDRD
jgi:subtilisin family serine protease